MSAFFVLPMCSGDNVNGFASGIATMGVETVLALALEGDNGFAEERSGRDRDRVV